ETVEQLKERLEKSQLARRVVSLVGHRNVVEAGNHGRELGSSPGTEARKSRVPLAHKWPQSPQQRRVGELSVALLDPLAAKHQDIPPGEPLLELDYQTRLAD